MISLYEKRTALGEFIREPKWDLNGIITPRFPTPTERLGKPFKYFFKHLNRPTYVFYDKFILCWVFFERFGNRKGVHIHTLIKGISPIHAPTLQKKCNGFFGNAIISPYDPNKKGAFYGIKHYGTEELDDFTFWKINSKWRGGANAFKNV
ncbi:hypothetical protein ACFL5X_01065 [Candidatus Omnitrophota bacterium]